MFCHSSLFPVLSSFFHRLISRGLSADHHQTLPPLVTTKIYKNGSVIWDASHKTWRPKKHQIFGQLLYLRENISRLEQNIANRKTALQATVIPVHTNLIV